MIPAIDPSQTYSVPMEDIEDAIEAHKEYIVGRYILDVFHFIYHHKLGQNCEGLQPLTVAPEQLQREEGFVDDHGHHCRCCVEEVVREAIEIAVVAQCKGFPEDEQVTGIDRQASEYKFHYEQVQSLPAQEHIDVPGHEDHSVQLLSFIRDASDIFRFEDLEEQDQHGNQMKKVSYQLEDIHVAFLLLLLLQLQEKQ